MVPQTDPPLHPTCIADGDDDKCHQDLSRDSNPDIPPDSSWVPTENEFEWFDRNSFIQRKGSIKITLSRVSDRTSNNSSSQRSMSHKQNSSSSSFIGGGALPNFHKKSSIVHKRNSCKPENLRLFRSRSEPGGNSSLQVNEPGSPKVSCMGRVGSRKGRGKRNGFWASFKAVFS